MLVVDRVAVVSGASHILKDVCLSVKQGEVLGVVGPNGAGKSTLLDVLSGFVRPTRGIVREVNRESTLSSAMLQRRFARLHQVLLVPETASVAEFVSTAIGGCAIRSLLRSRLSAQLEFDVLCEKKPWVADACEMGGLSDSRRAIGSLSWGQKRLVALLAVVSTGKSLLLDEPLAGLSEKLCESVKLIIRHEAARAAVVVVEHDIDSVLSISNRVVLMRDGGVVKECPAKEITRDTLLSEWWGGQ